MPLWGDTDTANSAPKYLKATDDAYFVDETEAAVAGNKAKGLGTPGWNLYNTYVDCDGNTRHRAESLIPMKRTAVAAGDLGANDPIAATAIVANTVYVIVTTGNTDFTTIGAANSDPGVVFTANGAGTGTGTVRVDEDTTVADS